MEAGFVELDVTSFSTTGVCVTPAPSMPVHALAEADRHEDDCDGSTSHGSDFEFGPASYPGRIFVLKFQLLPDIPSATPR